MAGALSRKWHICINQVGYQRNKSPPTFQLKLLTHLTQSFIWCRSNHHKVSFSTAPFLQITFICPLEHVFINLFTTILPPQLPIYLSAGDLSQQCFLHNKMMLSIFYNRSPYVSDKCSDTSGTEFSSKYKYNSSIFYKSFSFASLNIFVTSYTI